MSDNVRFKLGKGVNTLLFAPKTSISSDGQVIPTNLPSVSGGEDGHDLIISHSNAHDKQSKIAETFNEQVRNSSHFIIKCRGGDNPPKALYLAYSGTLTIEGTEFDITLGQGKSGSYYPWYLSGPNVLAVSKKDENLGYLIKSRDLVEPVYQVEADGSDAFKVSAY